MKDNCFTEFCGFLSPINKNEPQVYPCPLSPWPTLQPVSEPVWVLWVTQQIPAGSLFYTWYGKFLSLSPYRLPFSLLSPHHVHRSVLYACSIAALMLLFETCIFSSVQFSCSVMSNSSQPHEPQHTRPPCPSKELPRKEGHDQPRQHIKNQRHYFANKGPSGQGYGFSSGHIWMW